MESLRADSGLSRGYPGTTCARGGALQAAVSACSAPEPAGMPACAGAAAAGWVRPRRSRSPCVHESAGWRAAWELTHAGGAGEAVAGAVVSDTAGFSGCWGVRMESLRADSGLSRGYPETTCALGGALQGRCERVFRAGTGRNAECRRTLALPPPGGCDRGDPGARVCAGAPAVRRLEIDPRRRRGEAVAGAVVSEAAGIQRCCESEWRA